VLDDQLEGKDLDWARDHLRRCDACRERVEDFREILLRVERLPSVSVPHSAIAAAFAISAPPALRPEGTEPELYPFPARTDKPVSDTELVELTSHPARQEVAPAADLLSDLEREIFREPPTWQEKPPTPRWQEKPPAATEQVGVPEEETPMAAEAGPAEVGEGQGFQPSLLEPIRFEKIEPQPIKPAAREAEPFMPAMPEGTMIRPLKEVEVESGPPPSLAAQPAPAWHEAEIEEGAMAETTDEAERPPKADTLMRWVVGLGAAAAVLLAALLYEAGGLLGNPKKTATASPRPSVTAPAQSVKPSPSVAASVSPSAAPTPTPAPVVATLGQGYEGASLFQIRMGTADAAFTRLVFDMRGGLPTMVVTRPDDNHLVVTFKKTTGAGVPVGGLRSNRVSGVEPAVQQGPDLAITIDLARPARVNAFTLPAQGSYAWRLVLDLYSA
jgi:hypothetical protein